MAQDHFHGRHEPSSPSSVTEAWYQDIERNDAIYIYIRAIYFRNITKHIYAEDFRTAVLKLGVYRVFFFFLTDKRQPNAPPDGASVASYTASRGGLIVDVGS